MKEVYNERIDKILSACGLLSRKDAKIASRDGRITVNGKHIKDSGFKVTQSDILCFDGKEVVYTRYVYILLNKPAGYVCSTDERDGVPVLTLLADISGSRALSPVGRLDKNTTGALLITDDGVLGHLLLSPARHVKKEYLCETELPIDESCIAAFANGIDIGEESKTLPAELEITDTNKAVLTIVEGKFHQVKRMFAALGNKVVSLHRLSFAGLCADASEEAGKWRFLTDEEIERLFALTGKT